MPASATDLAGVPVTCRRHGEHLGRDWIVRSIIRQITR
ncbi:Protein of unknown function [Pyronema omphalodes CBS 100304]|uniref:Uncharacterized protein n=1 Tax=Pyronema omphalodes (strain CBS 100304) TaxID=1076935 RepID=U4LMM1_PYROM|nr:Protein of unknown function [Pyronema omphalodes CBS 100304]